MGRKYNKAIATIVTNIKTVKLKSENTYIKISKNDSRPDAPA